MNRSICVCVEFLTPALEEKLRTVATEIGFEIAFFSKGQTEEIAAYLQHCEVLYSMHPEIIRLAPKGVKWIASPSAGVEKILKDKAIFSNPDCSFTNSSGAYGMTMSEHLVMSTLMLMRNMQVNFREFVNHAWSPKRPMRSIRGCRVTVLGTGNVGTLFAQSMKALGASNVIGLNRSGHCEESAFDQIYPISQLDAVLPETEVLMMGLPSTAETKGILSKARIALLPSNALVLNVGRGEAIDQDALMDALNKEQLAGASLDVVYPEPLPADHPLWETKNLILTSHISGNMTLGYTRDTAADFFCDNLRRYASGAPLEHVVNMDLGY